MYWNAASSLYSTEDFCVEIDQRRHGNDTREDEATPILIISRISKRIFMDLANEIDEILRYLPNVIRIFSQLC